MSKPEWLVEQEKKKHVKAYEPRLCVDCIYFGKFVKFTKHKGKEKCEVHECDIHPGCFNTKFSVCCGDWTKA